MIWSCFPKVFLVLWLSHQTLVAVDDQGSNSPAWPDTQSADNPAHKHNHIKHIYTYTYMHMNTDTETHKQTHTQHVYTQLIKYYVWEIGLRCKKFWSFYGYEWELWYSLQNFYSLHKRWDKQNLMWMSICRFSHSSSHCIIESTKYS